jgi:hypothetical protein
MVRRKFDNDSTQHMLTLAKREPNSVQNLVKTVAIPELSKALGTPFLAVCSLSVDLQNDHFLLAKEEFWPQACCGLCKLHSSSDATTNTRVWQWSERHLQPELASHMEFAQDL